MFNPNQIKFVAEVMNNNDPLQQGKVQIYIPFLMHDWLPAHYPWAFGETQGIGGGIGYGVSRVPHVGSKIWCWAEKNNYKNWYYTSDVQLESVNPNSLFYTTISPSISSTASYPDAKYTLYKNGICIGVTDSLSSKEIFMYHSPQRYIKIDNTGLLHVQLGVDSLKMILTDILTQIQALTVISTAPTTPTGTPVNAAAFAAIATRINAMLG